MIRAMIDRLRVAFGVLFGKRYRELLELRLLRDEVLYIHAEMSDLEREAKYLKNKYGSGEEGGKT